MINVIRLSATSAVIPVIYEYIKDKNLINTDICCVMPTGRNKRSLVLRFSTHQSSPVIMSIPEFNGFLFNTEKPSVQPELRHFYMKQAVERLGTDDKLALFKRESPDFMENFITFAETGNAFFRFFREVKGELITADELAKNALYTDYEKQTAILHSLWDSYTKVLDENGLSDPASVFDNPSFNDFFTNRFKGYLFLISGLLTRHEIRTLKMLAETSNIHLFFHFDGEKTNNHKEIESILNIEIPDDKEPRHTQVIEVIETGSRLEEYEFIIEKVFETNAKGVAFNRMAVILPDEKMKSYFMENDVYNLFNITSGTDGTYSEIYQSAEIIKEAVEETQSYSGFMRIETAEKLAAQPFFQKISGFDSLKNSLEDYVKKGRLLLSFAEISKAPGVRVTLEPFFEESVLTLTETARKLTLLTRKFLETTQDERETQQGTLVLKELKRLQKVYEAIEDKFPLHIAMGQILNSIASLKFHRPGGDVTVMGLLETRNMQFDAVFIPNMNADVFPPSSDKDLFLNTEIRRHLSLPTFQDREHLIKNYMSQVVAKSKFAYFSCISRDKGSSYRSPFIEELIIKKHLIPRSYSSSGLYIFDTKDGGFKTETVNVFKPDKLIGEKLKRRGISATMLNDYIACAYKFYMKYILAVRPAERPENSIAPFEYGNVLHEILEEIYKDALPLSAHELHTKLKTGLMEQLQKFDAYRTNPIEKEHAEDLADKLYLFAKNEMERFEAGWIPQAGEEVFEAEIENFRIKGRLDRIDKNSTRVAVIDYKLKSLKEVKDFKPDKIKDVQMPLYALLYKLKHGRLPDEVLWYDLKENFTTIRAFNLEYMDEFNEFIIELLKNISNSEQEYARTDKTANCRNCDYKLICGRN